jgi:hypothetical protein
MPKIFPASTLLVAAHPPMKDARVADIAPSIPCARRSPNSKTSSPLAASQTRAALVATKVAKFSMFSNAVSTICAWSSGPFTRTSGSLAKTAVPSGIASTSSVNRSRRR